MSEITTRAEHAAVDGLQATMTVGEVERLLYAAAEYARAQQPAAVYQTAVTALPAATGHVPPHHPGIDVTIPSPPETVGWAPLRRRVPQGPTWGVRLVYASLAVFLAGAGAAAATDGNPGAIAAIAAGIAGTAVGGRRALAEENEREARA